MSLRNFRSLRVTAGLVAAVLAVSLSAACGSSGPGDRAGQATAWALTGGDERTFRSSFQQWNSGHGGQPIDVQFFQNDAYKQKIRTAVGAGQAPTLIFGWGGGILKSYVDAGQVADLTPDVTANPTLKSRYLPSVLDSGVIGGKTYALPNNAMQPVLLYYNKDLFRQIGAQPPKTWPELLALIPKFNARNIAPLSLAGQSKWPLLMYEEYLVDRLGGPRVFDDIAANKPNAWSDPAVLQANTMIQQLVNAGAFVKNFASVDADSNADLALLYTGKAAMEVMGSWAYPSIKTQNPQFISGGKLGYVAFPAVPGGKGDPADVAGNPANFWSISAKATPEQRKAAVAYLTDGVLNQSYVDSLVTGGGVPPVAGLEPKLAKASDPGYLSFIYGMARQAPHFQLSWDQALSPAQADALLTNLGKLFLNQITPAQFSAAMNATIGK
ncbi:extracellular solute-binding protein [Fodinicola acaciae]|uniref:extracellular solute-binding protein n=1 Tax=Fodinicola acaciae TaxID=2681555 RepID=UPI0013D0AD47|nr:extracellular solute-binding protein [Fodinicola acaciae]